MVDEAYEQGVRDGRIKHLESAVDDHKIEMREIRVVLKQQGHVISMLIGAFVLIQFLPEIRKVLGL